METTKQYSLAAPVGIFLLALAAVGVVFVIPVAEGAVNPFATHWRTAAGTASMVLFVGAALIFLKGLKIFKSKLRLAYRLIAFGIMAFSVALIQLVIWGMMDLWDTAWATSGSGLLPYVVTAALIYIGTRTFARLLGIRGVLTSFRIVFGATLVIAVLMYIAASMWVTYDLEGTNVYIAVGAWTSSYLLAAAILAYKIYRSIGMYYQESMRWLFIGLAALCAAAWHETINTFWFNNGDTYTDYGWYLIPWVVAGLILVLASYQFRKLSNVVVTGGTGTKAEANDRDYIDSLVTISQLASQPKDIDSFMDQLRSITARPAPNNGLSTSDKERLIKTYHHLEDYLAHNDPLRTFSQEEILQHATPGFRSIVESHA